MSAPVSEPRTFHMIEAVTSRLEGAPHQVRRRWSDEFKAQAVAEAMQPGASVSAIAHRIGIDPSQLFTWRRNARQQSADPLTKVNDGTLHGGATSKCAAVEIAIGDAVIRAGTEVDEAYLARVIRAVRAA
jgi:transposase